MGYSGAPRDGDALDGERVRRPIRWVIRIAHAELERHVIGARVLVVGGGPAALSAAEELRRLGFSGELTVVAEEPRPPYDRTACSKDVLTGRRRPSEVVLSSGYPNQIGWRHGGRAVAVDTEARTVVTDAGRTYHYDGLVVATGTRPVLPLGWVPGAPGLHTVHGLADVEPLRYDLRRAGRVVVVGAGLIGCEVAYGVRSLLRECVLVDSSPQVLSRAIGDCVGGLVTQEMRADGIPMWLGRTVESVINVGDHWQVELDDGEIIDADVVVATMGERPDTSWLSGTGLDLVDGIRCDPALRVVETDGRLVDGVVAAGSVARWPNLRYGTRLTRYGQWVSARDQGRAAARSLLDPDPPPVTLVPRFWSQLGDVRIQVAGEWPDDADVTVTAVEPGRRDARSGVLLSYTVDGRPVGLVALNAPSVFAESARFLCAAAQS